MTEFSVKYITERHNSKMDWDILAIVFWGIYPNAITLELYLNLIRNMCSGATLSKLLYLR